MTVGAAWASSELATGGCAIAETADSRLEVIAIEATAAARRTARGVVFMAGLLVAVVVDGPYCVRATHVQSFAGLKPT
jgi:hypothetical protein